MGNVDKSAIQLELKYCERCGGLWLRPIGSELILLPPCVKATAGVLRAWSRETSTAVQPASIDSRLEPTFWGEGGNA
jgi:hypothetical protein